MLMDRSCIALRKLLKMPLEVRQNFGITISLHGPLQPGATRACDLSESIGKKPECTDADLLLVQIAD